MKKVIKLTESELTALVKRVIKEVAEEPILDNKERIFGTFGFPKLGITGAAIGTLFSRIIMVYFLWIIFKKKDKFKPYITGFNFKKIEEGINSYFEK